MEGVTVLNVIESNGGLIVAGIITLILSIAAIRLTIGCYQEGEWLLGIISTIITFFAILIAILMTIALFSPPKPRYEVTLSENVNMTEFSERYKVIEQRGKIFIIEERKNYKEANQNGKE